MPNQRTSREIPPPLELQCLKALWMLGEANVKAVRQVVTKDRALAYTTVMTVLDRLVRRGGVGRRKVGRSFVYSPLLTRDSLRRLAVQQLVECFFDGSEDTLRSYLDSRTALDIRIPDPVADVRLDASLL
ncbi:MAG TPA: BlaI/MecI/CopY family transcriptional regulator [Bryobacteraceae bacterium]|nr:BlaI/MecI/CopY family transcriptional regulator [Bryobacteraceae bacterium]